MPQEAVIGNWGQGFGIQASGIGPIRSVPSIQSIPSWEKSISSTSLISFVSFKGKKETQGGIAASALAASSQ
jgi:hypothetical protein